MRREVAELARILRTNRAARWIVIAIVTVNMGFIGLHGLSLTLSMVTDNQGWLRGPAYRINEDRSLAEFLNYVQGTACCALLFLAYIRTGARIYLGWAIVLAVVVLDDALLLHERIGGQLTAMGPMAALPGLRVQDTGELIVWAAAGVLVLVTLAWAFKRNADEDVARGALFGATFALLVFFAVLLDMLHVAIGASRLWDAMLAVVEDGGEMLSLAAALACASLIHFRLEHSTGPKEAEGSRSTPAGSRANDPEVASAPDLQPLL